jgi:hypothetical protein
MKPEQKNEIAQALREQTVAFNKLSKLVTKLGKTIEQRSATPETPPNWKPHKPTRKLDLEHGEPNA